MFQSDELKKHLEESSTVRTQSAVIAEWNMNIPKNIFAIGNYRYRPLSGTDSIYSTLINTFDPNDADSGAGGISGVSEGISVGIPPSDPAPNPPNIEPPPPQPLKSLS